MARQKLLPFPDDEVRQSIADPNASGPAGGDTRNVSEPVRVSQAIPALNNDTETTGSSLFDEVLLPKTLNQAWNQVRANQGAPGVDGITIEQFPEWLGEHKERVLAALRDSSYQPSPVRRVDIPKPGGGTRMLGVPTVLDRVIQQAIVIVLTPILDPTFSRSSFGFRPKKSAHDAVRQAREFVRQGHRWVVDLDLSKFFDRVNHDILLERLARKISDKRLLRLIGRYLRAGMMSEGVVHAREEGTPQGGAALASNRSAKFVLGWWHYRRD